MNKSKPYKSIDPQTTINNIRNILYECGLFLTEESSQTLDFFSSRLIVSNDEISNLGVGQNGKGMTSAYALASAYGEFMERLQNYNIFIDGLAYARRENIKNYSDIFIKKLLDNNLILDFTFDPKERRLSYNELSKNQQNICNEIAKHNTFASKIFQSDLSSKLLFAPFYCVKEKCSDYLPIGLIYMLAKSNGMCAGNTKEEAILQGICEIFERYVIKYIYKYEITPPSIPVELFKGSKIYELINKFESENNITIQIKDCSLDKGLPVIGLLVIDHSSNSYAFHLGSDPSPVISLERCFTELFQCRTLSDSLIKIDLSKDPFETHGTSRSERINEEFYKFITNGTGLLPNCILSSDSSYSFKGFNNKLNKSDQVDLSYLINKITDLGFNIYIRNVSFLNFPSFFIYIPGMSEIESVYNENNKWNETKYKNSTLYNIKNNSSIENKQSIRILESTKNNFIKLFPYNTADENTIDRHFLLALIHYKLSNYTESYKNLSSMISHFDKNEIEDNIYLLCIRDFIFYKSKDFSNQEIVNKLSNIYQKELLLEIAEDLREGSDIFQYQNFPTCFNCEICPIKNKCVYLDVLKLLKRIQEKHKSNQIDQYKLNWISNINNK